jgi:hypothetical protein
MNKKEQHYPDYLRKLIEVYFKDGPKLTDANSTILIPGIPIDRKFLEWLGKQGPTLALFGLKSENNGIIKPSNSVSNRDVWVMEYNGH